MTKLRMLVLAAMVMLGPTGTGAAAAAETVSGPADVRDGVTVAIGGARYRLQGVEVDGGRCGASGCGDAAAEALGQWIGGAPLSCEKLSRLGHGFFLARCRTASGEDLGRKLLEQGFARPGEGADAVYVEASEGAKAAHKGRWAQ